MILEAFFKRIETQYEQQLPFVVYRKPNKSEVKVLLQQTADLYFTTKFIEQGFVFSPFDDSVNTVLMPFKNSEVLIAECKTTQSGSAYKATEIQRNSTDEKFKNYHIKLVKKGVEAIKNDAFKKVVLSRTEDVLLQEVNPISIFQRLLNNYLSAFVYCWYHPKIGLWLGATPETLVKIEGNRFSIMALAGTQVYNGTLDVVWQDKEIKEQQFVTDFVVDNLKPLVESIEVSDTNTVKAGNLLHLKTMISAQLKLDSNLKEVISAIHPTPAVCGVPKQAAKDFILNYENYNREFYTGFLGELNLETTTTLRSGKRNIENRAYTFNRKSTQLYVNLRCMQLKNSQATIYVGGGITKSSDAEKEWDETVAKSLVIKNVLS
ncbi:chorismate-binding protein [Seonamhaeicola aphaedonensis]|uniref:Isochorismate synthase n=1 Tax=Seonamhaeicola aphaedonensis TaxID=1461338 RepID=A0A3D9HIH3_9FLAO|nr:chorismate-binding protein [Seonamhaeicola aphaedonensis]RED49258.1 isochorismate synthase [Seonamhaeicola aphaedonensis]